MVALPCMSIACFGDTTSGSQPILATSDAFMPSSDISDDASSSPIEGTGDKTPAVPATYLDDSASVPFSAALLRVYSPASKSVFFRRAAFSAALHQEPSPAEPVGLNSSSVSVFRRTPYAVYDPATNDLRVASIASKNTIRWRMMEPFATDASFAVRHTERDVAERWADELVVRADLEMEGEKGIGEIEDVSGLRVPVIGGARLAEDLWTIGDIIRNAPESKWERGVRGDYFDVKLIVLDRDEDDPLRMLVCNRYSHAATLRALRRLNDVREIFKGYLFIRRSLDEQGGTEYGLEKLLVKSDADDRVKMSCFNNLLSIFKAAGIRYDFREISRAVSELMPPRRPSLDGIFEAYQRFRGAGERGTNREVRSRPRNNGSVVVIDNDLDGNPIQRWIHWSEGSGG